MHESRKYPDLPRRDKAREAKSDMKFAGIRKHSSPGKDSTRTAKKYFRA